MAVYFTSDLHFGHKAIINYDSRPFFSVSEMNAELIKRWNNKVNKNDLTYVLGDLFWNGDFDFVQDVLKRLSGQIILIKGNHDHWLHNAGNKKLLSGIKDYDDIKVTLKDGTVKRCILSHYFMPFYNGHFNNAIHLHGHTHVYKQVHLFCGTGIYVCLCMHVSCAYTICTRMHRGPYTVTPKDGLDLNFL